MTSGADVSRKKWRDFIFSGQPKVLFEFLHIKLYFKSSAYLHEVRYMDITNKPFCLKKSKVTHSMRIRTSPMSPGST